MPGCDSERNNSASRSAAARSASVCPTKLMRFTTHFWGGDCALS